MSDILGVVVEVLRHVFEPARDPKHRVHPALAAVGILSLGAALGGLVTWWLPIRVLGVPALPGASVVILSLANGVLMYYVGRWQSQRQLHPSFAATFWGGVLFALGFSVVRLLMLADVS